MTTPTKYRSEYAGQAREACRDGATKEDLADKFKVGTTTIDRWLRKCPDFKQAVLDGRGVADDEVKRKLFERATGYTFEEQKVFCNAKGEVTKVTVEKHMPREVLAQNFWLKNQCPGEWRDRREEVIENKTASEMTDEQRAARLIEIFERAHARREYEERLRQVDLKIITKGNGQGKFDGSADPFH